MRRAGSGGDRIGVMGPKIGQEGIGMKGADAGRQRARRKIAQVHSDDHPCPGFQGRRQHMQVRRVWQIEALGAGLLARRDGLGEAQAHKCGLGPGDLRIAGAEFCRRAGPFAKDAFGPDRPEQPRRRDIGQDLAQHGREQDIGVKDRDHPSSRKNSAFR